MKMINSLYRSIFSIIIILAIMNGCSKNEMHFRNNDPFYRSSGEIDFLRLPLLKPYDVIKGSDEHGWTIDLFSPSNESSHYLSVFHSKKIAVENGKIFVYTNSSEQGNKGRNEKNLFWFILNPENEKEIGFSSEDEFLSYIESNGLNEPKWIDIDKAYEQFNETGCLNWIPDCR